MKVTVLIRFRDKYNHKVVFEPGLTMDFDNDRAVALAARGLVKLLVEAPVNPGGDSVNDASDENGASKTSGKGKGKAKSSKKDKEAAVEAIALVSENEEDKPESEPASKDNE